MAAAQATHSNVVVAGRRSGRRAMSMAAGEVAVPSETSADTEQAELARERTEPHADAQGEHEELMAITSVAALIQRSRTRWPSTMAHDALGAHARDELGITRERRRCVVLQAALASACSFAGAPPAAPWVGAARRAGAGDGGRPARHLLGHWPWGSPPASRRLRHRGVSAGHWAHRRHPPHGMPPLASPGAVGLWWAGKTRKRFFRNVW